ncbi:hypothetical protein EAO28_05660 [Klebsiella pneumoniae]|uniref:Uncharacterized protein n=1 Tax=Klebsiella pneumoniae TaxID=573 RepID=A0A3P2EFU2_KLEPN|nr:hypothetical protein EAO28_05660 [Klebsiella pneumoniae]
MLQIMTRRFTLYAYGKTLLHGDVLIWLMKTLLTSLCISQRELVITASNLNSAINALLIGSPVIFGGRISPCSGGQIQCATIFIYLVDLVDDVHIQL